MLLTITTTHKPATDLGYLLFKHPDRVSEFPQNFGDAWVFFPEATQERCTAALLLDVDAVKLAKASGKHGSNAASSDASLARYVNDRPYAASSLLGVALARVFSTARSGRADVEHQWLADQPIPLEVRIPVMPARGGKEMVESIFIPLGWNVMANPIELDDQFPEWGDSPYVDLTLTGTMRLADALNQMHVLLPVFDESKHYWQGDDEVDKLLRSGGGWLENHPQRELIARKYLAKSGELTRAALSRLAELDDGEAGVDGEATGDEETECVESERKEPLRIQRQQAVMKVLRETGARSVADLGCGPGALLALLLKDSQFQRIIGTDISMRALQTAASRLYLDEMGERQAERIKLFQSSLTYEDNRLAGFDAAVLMEVIEHIDEARLPAVERAVFQVASPSVVVVTTPNGEYNEAYEHLEGMRHADHRFEWSREQFQTWAKRVADDFNYAVEFQGIGDTDSQLGTPTQMAVFSKVVNV